MQIQPTKASVPHPAKTGPKKPIIAFVEQNKFSFSFNLSYNTGLVAALADEFEERPGVVTHGCDREVGLAGATQGAHGDLPDIFATSQDAVERRHVVLRELQ